ncbi:MAG TPA: membrane dipeptidase [Bryobacteraceae bacterium]|nr:membrane dipeptidase [Bryobacteraceae bacterium]
MALMDVALYHVINTSIDLWRPIRNDATEPRLGGLTAFGADVIKEGNRLGMLIDLAHANLQTTEAALKATTRPVIISHTGLDTQLGNNPSMAGLMRPRLISKEQAGMVANAGGVIGVWTHLAETPLDYAKNVRALVDVIGVDHVCIGTDTKITPPFGGRGGGRPGQQNARIGERTNLAWQDQTAGFYYVVVDALLKTGFTPDETGKIGGGNFLRIFGESVKK